MTVQTEFEETVVREIPPEEWEVKELGQVCQLEKKQYNPSKKDVRAYIGLEHIEQQNLKLINIGSTEDIDSNKFEFKAGQILFGKLRNPISEKFTDPSLMAYALLIFGIIDSKGQFDNGFLFYFLADQRIINEASNSSEGTRMPRARWDYLSRLKFAFPPLSEQRSIASILGSLDDKIAHNRSMNSTLEAIVQALFRRWFVDFEFPDGHGRPYRSSGGEMVDTELGEVPRRWRVMTVGEILELAYGKPLKDENRLKGNVPVYGSNGQIGWHNEKLIEGPGIVVGRKGNPGIVTWSNKAFFPIDTTFYVVPKAIRSMYYLFYVLRLQDLQSLGADSAVPGLNRNVVYMNKMIVPSSETLEIFDAFLRKIYNKVQDNNEQSDILTEIRDALLPKLMSGEIRVNIFENGKVK